MKTVKIITCHDVYNSGASLQAYALYSYLQNEGYDVEIIDYKPEYLTRHYRLSVISNPRYNKPFLRELYLAAKLPGRLRARKSRKKKEFDQFRDTYLGLTKEAYHTNEDLKKGCLKADTFIAGSDQIWNCYYETGKDPSFYLDFVTSGKKISYAASFAINEIPVQWQGVLRERLEKFDAISVREKSGIALLEQIGLKGELVCDPVFLISKKTWRDLCPQKNPAKKYVYLYDFDNTEFVRRIVEEISDVKELEIESYFYRPYAQKCDEGGPLTFLESVINAETVVSNSFHATAFSLIFHKEFFVVARQEPISSRMSDLLETVGLQDRFIQAPGQWKSAAAIDWDRVDRSLKSYVDKSKTFLKNALEA